MTCRSGNWLTSRPQLQSSAKEFRHSLTEPYQPTAEWTTRRRLLISLLRGLLGRLRRNHYTILQLQEKTAITSSANVAVGGRNHHPPHRPGLHLELAPKGIEGTERATRSPNRRLSRAILHIAGRCGQLRYSYPGYYRPPAVRTVRTQERHTPNIPGSAFFAMRVLLAILYQCHSCTMGAE
jgi:hypothetical protein